MSTFTNETGEPRLVPASVRYKAEPDSIDLGGHNLAKSEKLRDVARTGRAAFVVDDVLPPWQACGVEVRGRAKVERKRAERRSTRTSTPS